MRLGVLFAVHLDVCTPPFLSIQLALHKQQMILEAKCKKALDLHLNFIVHQTEKYSSWLVKDFGDMSGTATPITVQEAGVCVCVCMRACVCVRVCTCMWYIQYFP